MQEITYSSYREYKQAVTAELYKEAEGFVRIGYLLKVARDTDILKESGYTTVFDFAAAEYNLTKDVVSRWIGINDRFSKGGYSMELDDRFGAFGPTKLGEMLTLPDAVIDVIPETVTRDDIRDLKKEIKKEQAISDLEVLAEKNEIMQAEEDSGNTSGEKSLFLQLLLIWLHQTSPNTDRFERVRLIKPVNINTILDVLAPSGKDMFTVRLPGAGSYIISIRGKDYPIGILNMRNNERTNVEWQEAIYDIEQFQRPIMGMDVYTAWEMVYDEDIFPADALGPEEQTIAEPDTSENEVNVVKSESCTVSEENAATTVRPTAVNEAETEVAPAQQEMEKEKKPKPLMNEELPEQQLHIYTVQFRCTAGEYKQMKTWAGNRSIKFKKIGER